MIQRELQYTFSKAGEQLTQVKLTDYEGNVRIVEPYMIYDSSSGKRLFHMYQLSGYSKSENPSGWKNPEVDSFHKIEILKSNYIQRREYNPFNYSMFSKVIFAIPTREGKKRL